MESTFNQVMKDLPRREIFAFQQWMKSLPKEQTMFLYQTFDAEEVRVQKLKDLYNRYKTERNKGI